MTRLSEKSDQQQTDDDNAFSAEEITQTPPNEGAGDLTHEKGRCQQTHIRSNVFIRDVGEINADEEGRVGDDHGSKG